MRRVALPQARRPAFWLVVGLCLTVGLFGWFAYQAVTGWQRTLTLLAWRRAGESAELLAMALARDMRAVQRTVLTSPHWDEFMLDAPYDVTTVVASAFARYPYPEVFIAARGSLDPEQVVFFNRAERPPHWMPEVSGARFPVTAGSHAQVARGMVARIGRDGARGRRFSIFETVIAGVPYQVVVRLMYRDALREHLEGVFGFMVNVDWVREHYFEEVAQQVTALGGVSDGLSLTVVDDRNLVVAGRPGPAGGAREIRRGFPLLFFDPLLVELDPPDDLTQREWMVAVSELADPALAAAIRGAQRTLIASALSVAVLAAGLVLTARATRARARLVEMRSDFVSTVTHELKTPIATIRALGDTLVSGRLATPGAHRQYASLVVQESKRLTRLVDNLLAYARITDVTEVYSFEPLSPAELVDEVVQRFWPVLSEKGFSVTVDVPTTLPALRADRTAMELLLDNLLDNAIRYSGDGREIAIAGTVAGEGVRLAIRDRGIGITAEELEHVTRKFYRGRRAGSGGSGLGLAIANRIVADHGGTLAIDSEPAGRGTVVSVTLPLAETLHA